MNKKKKKKKRTRVSHLVLASRVKFIVYVSAGIERDVDRNCSVAFDMRGTSDSPELNASASDEIHTYNKGYLTDLHRYLQLVIERVFQGETKGARKLERVRYEMRRNDKV